MNFKLLLYCALLYGGSASAQMTYSKVKIYTDNLGLQRLWDEGLPVDHGVIKQGEHFTTDLSNVEIRTLDSLDFAYEILVPDVIEHYQNHILSQIAESSPRNQTCEGGQADEIDLTPTNFLLPTTYGGFYKYAEMLTELNKMALLYPNLISAKSGISTFVTAQNRPIYHVRISNSPNMDNGNPRVLYSAVHHAREPLSMSQLIFFMWYLLENYGTNPEATFLVDNTQLFFVPCINPDGYVYNETNTPAGGGMHRKNRNPNVGTTNRGVDLNRNYSYQWGTTGISTNVNNDTYPGASAFSEPETQAMRWLVRTYNITSGFNAHTHGNDILFPIGSTSQEYAPHHDYLNALAGHFCRENNYGFYKSSGLYPASGDSDDYMYKVDVGVQQKDTMFVMTPEIGTAFWPARAEIIPTSKDMLQPNLGIAHMVHTYYIGESTDTYNIEDLTGNFNISIKKLGRKPGNTTVSITPILNISSISSAQTVHYNVMQEGVLTFNYQLTSGLAAGSLVKYVLEINDGVYHQRDTITHKYGTEEVLFSDNGNNINNWTGNWGTTASTFYSAPRSITDSPSGNYTNNVNSNLQLNQVIDLADVETAKVTFWTKWAIESGYDYAQFQVSTDNGASWVPQCGRYTVLGVSNQGGVQPLNQPLWSGTKSSWVEEEISLSDYVGQEIKVRFVMRSDGGSRADGFYFDEFKVVVTYPVDPVAPEEPEEPEEPENPIDGLFVSKDVLNNINVYPNPFNNQITIDGWLEGMMMQVHDVSGRIMEVDQLENRCVMKELSSGKYFISIYWEDQVKVIKIVK